MWPRIAARFSDGDRIDMSEPPKLPFEPDPRVLLAADRTLLAWVRSGLALMGFGFVVARFGLFLRELGAADHMLASQRGPFNGWVGTALMGLGVTVFITAPIRHAAFVRRYRAGLPLEPREFGVASAIAIVLAILGIALAAYLLLV